MEPQQTIYNIYDRDLYRLGTVVYANSGGLDTGNSGVTGVSSVSTIPPDTLGSGTLLGTFQQTNGNIAAVKTSFTDTAAGYILGFDTDGKAKFLIGNTTNSLYWNGTALIIVGNITATTGTIGGFTITATALYAGTGATRVQLDTTSGIHLGATAFADSLFSVSLAGALKSKSGTIGGTTITATELYGGIIKSSATVGVGSTGWIGDSAGLRGYDSVLGLTFNLPTNGSAPTFSSGIINSTIFEINTNAVLRTSETVGDGTANSAGILINNTGLYACEASQTLANANIKALIDGSIIVKGTINATAGKFGTATNYWSVGATGLTAVSASTDVIINYNKTDFTNTDPGFIIGYDFSALCSKVYIGNSTNYFNWDGTTITATGHLIINGTVIDSAFTQQFTCGHAITAGNAVYVADGVNGGLLNIDGAGSVGSSFTLASSGAIQRVAQSFKTTADTYIGAVLLDLNFGGGQLWLDIQADSAGVPSGTSLVGGYVVYTENPTGDIFRFKIPYKCIANTTYWAVLIGGTGATIYVMKGVEYADGKSMQYNGTTWSDTISTDIVFHMYEILPSGYIGKASASTIVSGCGTGIRYLNFIGMSTETKAIDAVAKTAIAGVTTGLTGLTPGVYYLSDTAGAIQTTAGSNSRKVGIAISATALEVSNVF